MDGWTENWVCLVYFDVVIFGGLNPLTNTATPTNGPHWGCLLQGQKRNLKKPGLIAQDTVGYRFFSFSGDFRSKRSSRRRRIDRGRRDQSFHLSLRSMEGPSKSEISHDVEKVERDALRFGLHGVKSDVVGAHPLQSLLHSVFSSLFF